MFEVDERNSVTILMPVYDDWPSCSILLRQLDEVLFESGMAAEVCLVDDGSFKSHVEGLSLGDYHALHRVNVIQLVRNVGHQRAIALGLAYLHDCGTPNSVVVMDSDGQDDPKDVVRLIKASKDSNQHDVIFAERRRRSESLSFTIFYHLYRFLHWFLTGIAVRVGNFSIISKRGVSTLVAYPDLWNHYAATIFKSKLMYRTIPTSRSERLDGSSKMNFVNLVVHGISAIAVFADIVGVRLLVTSLLGAGLGMIAVLTIIGLRFLTDLAIPGWATYSSGLAITFVALTVMLALFVSVSTLAARQNLGFLPIRDHVFFIRDATVVYGERNEA